MVEKITGSLNALSALELASMTEKLDMAGKELLKHKEILAVIAQGTIEEYQNCGLTEIMDFIEADSIESPEVSRGRTNTVIEGVPTDFEELHEKTSHFDVAFRAMNPRLSAAVRVNLHINFEVQKDYRPGYPIEKRGMYYLARRLSSQLNLITEKTDYGQLEKCISIWICRDRIPEKEQFSISACKMHNYKNIGKGRMQEEDYDLLELVIVRLGSSEYPEGKTDLFQFLTALFYPQKSDIRKIVGQYIDFETNLALEKEVTQMIGLGQSILEEGIAEGREIGKAEGKVEGRAEGKAEGKIEGRAEGKAEAVLDLLADIGVVSSELVEQIRAQNDEQVLRRWLKLAARSVSVEQFVEAM